MWSQVIDDVRCVEEPSYKELLEKNKKLEKALDKICQFNDDNYVVFKEEWVGGHDCGITLSVNEWKEWAMKDD